MLLAHGLTESQVFLILGVPLAAYVLGFVSLVKTSRAKRRRTSDAVLVLLTMLLGVGVLLIAIDAKEIWAIALLSPPGILGFVALLQWRRLPE